MAGDEEKTTVEGSEQAPAEQKQAGGLGRWMMLGGIGLGIIVVGVVLALFVVKPMLSSSEGDKSEQVVSGDNHQNSEDAKTEAKPKKKRSSGTTSESVVYSIKDIVVNPAGTGGSRFLSVSFGFDLASQNLASEFEQREPVVRDALITILSSKTVAQLTDPKQKEIIRLQIKRRVGQLLNTDELNGVYYTDFVLQ